MGKTHLHTCDPKRLLFCYVKSTHRRTQIDFNIFSNRLELFTFLGMKGAPLMHLYNTYLSFSTNFYIYDVHKSTLSHLYVQYYIKGLGIRSFALLLKIAHIKERLWAICSRHSLKKSYCEQIALGSCCSFIWATWVNRSRRSIQKSDPEKIALNFFEKRFFRMFLTVVPPFYAQERIAPAALCSNTLF